MRLKVTEFIRSNEAHMQTEQAYIKESKMEQNSIWATGKEILAPAKLIHNDIVMYSFCETFSAIW